MTFVPDLKYVLAQMSCLACRAFSSSQKRRKAALPFIKKKRMG
jgi:hypothetical protein